MTLEASLNKYQPQILSILRIVVGLVFLQHGLQKWFGFPVPIAGLANIHLFSMIGIAGVIEIVSAFFDYGPPVHSLCRVLRVR